MVPAQTALRLTLSCLFAFTLAGCSTKSPVVKSDVQSRPKKSISQLGAEMQGAGIMSQKDYIRIVNLGHNISNTHSISEEDFAWTLSLLKTAGNSIARARAMTVLSYIDPMTSAQKARITSAIAPFINNGDPLDAAEARSVQRSIQRT